MAFNTPFGRVLVPPFGPKLAAIVSAAVTLILDQFTDADSTSLDAHTIAPTNTPATAWTEQAGNWQITGNQACLAANVNSSIATCNPGIANTQISGKAKSTTGSAGMSTAAGLAARFADVNNFWSIVIQNVDDLFEINQRQSGVYTLRASASVPIDTSTFYTIIAILSGADITATLDGANQITFNSSFNQSSTVHGIRARQTTDRIDDFQVVTL